MINLSFSRFTYLIRALYYLLIAFSMSFAIYTDQLSKFLWFGVIACILYPHLLYSIERLLTKSSTYLLFDWICLIFDSCVIGILLAFVDFEPFFIFVLFLPVGFFAIIRGGTFIYLICIFDYLFNKTHKYHHIFSYEFFIVPSICSINLCSNSW